MKNTMKMKRNIILKMDFGKLGPTFLHSTHFVKVSDVCFEFFGLKFD